MPFGALGLFFIAALVVVGFTLVRSLYLREALGESIPEAEHETLLFARPRRGRVWPPRHGVARTISGRG